MALSSKVKNKLMATINQTLDSIGNAPGMNMPKTDSNNARIAWDYHIARHVQRMANARREKTEKACIDAGLLPDTETKPLPPGPNKIYYNGDHVVMMVEVRKPGVRVNVDDMIAILQRNGVNRTLLERARMQASTQSKAAHVFTTIWNEDNGQGK